jgi:hypothetical protein
MVDKPILEKNFNEGLDVEKRLKEGAILARLFIEIQGNNKEAAKKALERTIFDSLASEKYVSLLNVKLYDLKALKTKADQKTQEGVIGGEKNTEEIYSGVVEIKSLFRDFRWFINVIMRYGPSAIEIIQPESYTLNLEEMQSLVADVSSFSQTFSSQILTLLKDDERRALYQKMLSQS